LDISPFSLPLIYYQPWSMMQVDMDVYWVTTYDYWYYNKGDMLICFYMLIINYIS
jgi:hypothetical protein